MVYVYHYYRRNINFFATFRWAPISLRIPPKVDFLFRGPGHVVTRLGRALKFPAENDSILRISAVRGGLMHKSELH
jgi:hypothetical protein